MFAVLGLRYSWAAFRDVKCRQVSARQQQAPLWHGSGGWRDPKPGSAQEKDLAPVPLDDVGAEIGEKQNLPPEASGKLSRA